MFKNLILLKIFLIKEEKILFFVLVFLIMIAAVLEMLGLSLLPLYLYAIINYKDFINLINNNSIISINLSDDYLKYSSFNIMIAGLTFLFLFFISKNIYQLYVSYIQSKMILNISSRNALNLYKKYIRSDYLYFTKNNPSIMIRNINLIEDAVLFFSFFINISKECLYLFFSISILIFLDIKTTSVVFIIFIISIYLILLFTKNKSQKFAEKINDLRGDEIKEFNQSIESIKELKVYQQEDFFENRFKIITRGIYLNKFYLTLTHTIPKLVLEILSIVSILIIFILFLKDPISSELLLVKLSAFAVVLVRMLPSFSAIASNLTQMRSAAPALKLLHSEFLQKENKFNFDNKSKKKNSIFFKSFKILEVQNLNFFYNPSNMIIKNFSLNIKKGEKIGLIGDSAKGKSTLVNLILGLLIPNSGDIRINNKSIINKKINNNLFGLVQQNIYLFDDTIKKNIAFGIPDEYVDDDQINRVMKIAKIYESVSKMKHGVNTIIGNRGIKLSGGQIQRIGIARALYRNPSLLILDESTNSLDLKTEKEILDTINSLSNMSVLIISHRSSTLKFCDKILNL